MNWDVNLVLKIIALSGEFLDISILCIVFIIYKTGWPHPLEYDDAAFTKGHR